MTVLSPFTKLEVGDVLDGRYLLQEVIGEGAYGTVYRAEHVYTKRIVAIKILRDDVMTDEDVVRRFIREAQLASELDHINCVRVYEFGKSEGGKFYLVMECLEGETLGERLERVGRMTLPEARDIIDQLLSALKAAHQKGIIHRDVKPDNLMLVKTEQGERVKLLDFGFAKRPPELAVSLTGDGEVITRTGFSLGTPEYMAPEQALSKTIDPRTDLYSAGVILYRLLVGRPPFENENPLEVVLDQVKLPPPPPREVAPDAMIPEVVERVILRVLSKDPQERYPDAHSFAAALDAAIRSPAPEPKPTPPSMRPLAVSSNRSGQPGGVWGFLRPLFTRTFWTEDVAAGGWKRPETGARLAALLAFLLFLTVGALLLASKEETPAIPATLPTVVFIEVPPESAPILEEAPTSEVVDEPQEEPASEPASEPANEPASEPVSALQEEPPGSPEVEEARAFLAANDPEAAVPLLAELLRQDPKSLEGWLTLVHALAQLDRWDDARKAVAKARAIDASAKAPQEAIALALERFDDGGKVAKGARLFLIKSAPEAASQVGKKLSAPKYGTRVAAADVLGALGKSTSYDPVPALAEALAGEEQCEKKEPFIKALARFRGDERALAALKEEEKTTGLFGKNRCLAKVLPSLISKMK